jgi:hypothetical protein
VIRRFDAGLVLVQALQVAPHDGLMAGWPDEDKAAWGLEGMDDRICPLATFNRNWFTLETG